MKAEGSYRNRKYVTGMYAVSVAVLAYSLPLVLVHVVICQVVSRVFRLSRPGE